MKTRLATPPELDGDNGFTLVEILVVIIIIGILAAIAIPIFLNQQRVARDSATVQDVRNAAIAVETAFAQIPEANGVAFYSAEDELSPGSGERSEYFFAGGSDPDATKLATRAWTGPASFPTKITPYAYFTKTKGTIIVIETLGKDGNRASYPDPKLEKGSYRITGWNVDGQEHTTRATGVTYYSATGGIKK